VLELQAVPKKMANPAAAVIALRMCRPLFVNASHYLPVPGTPAISKSYRHAGRDCEKQNGPASILSKLSHQRCSAASPSKPFRIPLECSRQPRRAWLPSFRTSRAVRFRGQSPRRSEAPLEPGSIDSGL